MVKHFYGESEGKENKGFSRQGGFYNRSTLVGQYTGWRTHTIRNGDCRCRTQTTTCDTQDQGQSDELNYIAGKRLW